MSLFAVCLGFPTHQRARMIQTTFLNTQETPCPKAPVKTETVLLLQNGTDPLIICGLWMLPYY